MPLPRANPASRVLCGHLGADGVRKDAVTGLPAGLSFGPATGAESVRAPQLSVAAAGTRGPSETDRGIGNCSWWRWRSRKPNHRPNPNKSSIGGYFPSHTARRCHRTSGRKPIASRTCTSVRIGCNRSYPFAFEGGLFCASLALWRALWGEGGSVCPFATRSRGRAFPSPDDQNAGAAFTCSPACFGILTETVSMPYASRTAPRPSR